MISNPANIPPEDLARYQARVREAIEGEQHEYSSATFHKAKSNNADDDRLWQTLSAEQLDIPVDALKD